ncbi:MAG: flavin reductase family protein [Caldilinea sp.]|uniref:flavin reductase family protein n=1 Tax=Caldilinea sp. TaxID=2293560 RepID=UPI002B79285E|nr:flavin reductase family protein [Anaerolineales bacterium]HQY90035.1 flavin reductase family protein [Caldilinea sp.]HRA65941.1 flavin reductase family protein [Caldilinea sp.]
MSMDVQSFKDALAHWTSGVTVVTTQMDGRPVGITASSLTSVSLAPPQILICVARKLYTHQVIEQSGVFAVNILGTDHLEWGMRFAGMTPELADRFADIELQRGVTGAPILPDVLGWLDCRLRHAYDGGDHTIFVGEVVAAGATEERSPLLYFNRTWRQLDGTPLQLETAV